ncbi:glycosyltransferase [Algoriphagus namhaensis]|uniref:Glycosyltransferase n=1 Tax=Algoriphagus namhaensis TaxID=915353 RepID=A0ABV8AVG9_9BACT
MNKGISVIICTYNGDSRINKALQSIISQNTTYNFELIVVNNNSNDRTEDEVMTTLAESTIDWTLVKESTPGLSFARWRGIEEAKFELILFCDDDNILDKNYLEIGGSILFADQSIGILGGNGNPVFQNDKPDWFDDFSNSYAVGSLGKKSGKQVKGSYHYGASCFFRRNALLELRKRGFNSILSDRTGTILSSGGDVELCYAVQLLGYNLAFDTRLFFDHFIESHRLEWDYYLRLKRGIASSFPLLEAYKVDGFENIDSFKDFLNTTFITLLKGFLKTNFISKKSRKNEVSRVVIKQKIISYIKNYKQTIIAFTNNKLLFEN